MLAEQIDFQTISNEEIEDRRSQTAVPCGPGGTLHDYVPFHFGSRSPMMYRISCRNLPEYTGGQRPLVYLVTTVGKIVDAGLRFVIADGHPIMALTDFFDELARLDAVDLPLMRQRYWKDTAEDPDRERRRQAEFLVHERVPWETITEIGVMDAAIKGRVEQLLADAGHRAACRDQKIVVSRREVMIEMATGNLLDADVEALVNTVNTVGVMGKGIALQFKRKFPENFDVYAAACKRGEVEPGRMLVVESAHEGNPRFIINFPTKRHWRSPSRLEDVRDGLEALIGEIRDRGIRSVAIPPLGCGSGGLNWADVEPLVRDALAKVPDVRALVFAPTTRRAELAAPSQPARLTRGRAVLIKTCSPRRTPASKRAPRTTQGWNIDRETGTSRMCSGRLTRASSTSTRDGPTRRRSTVTRRYRTRSGSSSKWRRRSNTRWRRHGRGRSTRSGDATARSAVIHVAGSRTHRPRHPDPATAGFPPWDGSGTCRRVVRARPVAGRTLERGTTPGR